MQNEAETSVMCGVARYIPACLAALGVAPEPFLAARQLRVEDISHPDASLPFHVLAQLFTDAAITTRCADFGLLVGLCGGLHTLETMENDIRTSGSLPQTLEALCAPHSWYATNAYIFVQSSGQHATIRYAITNSEVTSGEQISEAALAVIYNVLHAVYGPSWAPNSLSVMRSARDNRSLKCFLEVPMQFGAPSVSLHFANKLLGKQHVEGAAHHKVVKMPKTLPDAVVCAYYGRLLDGKESNSAVVARELGMSRRTFHRKLASFGTSYQSLLDKSRFGVARRLLCDTDMTVTDIAFMLGFSDISAFTRAFTHWCGHPPTHLRREGRLDEGARQRRMH